MNTGINNLISFTKSTSLQLSVIIVNFNVKYFLEQCLASVLKAAKNIETEIMVVDNNSTDGSRAYFNGRFNKVQFIWNNENLGFSKANNLAIDKATGNHILFLNPDTILPEDCLEKCLAFIQQQENAGALGVRMIDGSGRFLKESKRGFPSLTTAFFKFAGLTGLFPSSPFFARYYLGHLDASKNHAVDVLAGAFMLVKKEVLDKTGGFDERFFMYGEDIDLSYRIQKAGYQNFYFSECTIIHFKGESTKKGNLDYVRLFYGAMGLFAEKHYGGRPAFFYKWIIRPGIWAQAFLSHTGYRLKNIVSLKQKNKVPARTLIMAPAGSFDFIESILQNSPTVPEVTRKVDTHNPGCLQDLPSIIAGQNVEAIIFCANGLSAGAIINLVQDLPADIHFKFHFDATFSIVGSRRKEVPGDCIGLEPA